MTEPTTDNAFLGGRLNLLQPANGFRSGLDAVLLAAAVRATSGQTVLEAGQGAGVASLCLAYRVPGVRVTGLEIDETMVELARRNAARNGLGDRVDSLMGDVAAPPDALRAQRFDQVFANPPFFDEGEALPAKEPGRERARMGAPGTLERWVAFCAQRTTSGGHMTILHRADRLAALLSLLEPRVGGLAVVPLWPRSGVAAKRVIVSGRVGSRAPLTLLPGLVLHEADGSYTAEADAILRDGAPMIFA